MYCNYITHSTRLQGKNAAAQKSPHRNRRIDSRASARRDCQSASYGFSNSSFYSRASARLPLVEQLAAAAKAYEDLYVTDLKVAQAAPTFSYTGKITNKAASYFEDEIFNLEVEAAATLIKALPASGATAAQIKAAKAAVEALGFDGICSIDRTLLTKLNRLEQNLALEVTSLKIKASSKATKGAMTIKWRVIDGNKDAAAGYQVWRSTKANKGFKKMITTKKMNYKNTKNLKKGTTYYYRVRAYAEVEGKVYFSDYSNKAYRKAK